MVENDERDLQADWSQLAALTPEAEEVQKLLLTLASALSSAEYAKEQIVVSSSRKQASRSEARYRALVEQIPAVTFMLALDEGKNEMYVSPQIEKILGFTAEEWLADPVLWFKQLHPDDKALWNAEFARGIATGGPFRADCRAIARNGEIKYIHGEAWLVRDDQGNPLILQGIAQDVTDIKRAEIAIREVQENKIRTERLAAVGQLAASIGHDLRNPLAAMRNAMHYIRKKIPSHPDPRVTLFMDLIEKELRNANRIIGDLLDFTRARPPMLQSIQLHDLVVDALSVVHPPRPIDFRNLVPKEGLLVEVDRDQFRQVLVNLLQNGAEAMPEDREGVIEITARADQTYAYIDIADNGAGIPPEKLDKIFEPLFTTKAKGTGLGLAIVSNICKSHGGDVTVTSTVGTGSRFKIKLPLQRIVEKQS